MKLPVYNTARGAATLTSMPPFDFQGVVMRVFPLKARIDVLSRFVDAYLNILPPEVAVFRPSAPFVYFMMINYGRMTSHVANAGWVAQNEFGFCVPLDWYRRERGRLVHRDIACVYPFIFVDDVGSQATGIEVYGWPKVQGGLTRRVDPWTQHPRDPRDLMALQSDVFTSDGDGRTLDTRVLVEVVEAAPPSFTHSPARFENALNPFVAIPAAVKGSLELMGIFADTLSAIPLRGYASDAGAGFGPARAAATMRRFQLPFGSPSFNCLNLKQFRDAERPDTACYQAVVNSTMTIARFNEGGMLGDGAAALGDSSGGYRLRLHRYDTLPVIELLGLDVESEHQGHGVRVATLRPILPSWWSVDMRYGVGDVLCWRTRDAGWTVPEARTVHEHPAGKRPRLPLAGSAAATEAARPPEPPPGPTAFNTAQGAALLSSPGPFRFSDVRMRVLPLLADASRLQAFCDAYLNLDPARRFEVLGSYVYLIAASYPTMSAGGGPGARWANRGVSFTVPVKWYEGGKLVSVAMLAPFKFFDTQRAVATAREVLGWAAQAATIDSPPNAWLDTAEPPGDGSALLSLSTQVLGSLGIGEKAETLPLLEIVQGDVLDPFDHAGWHAIAAGWGHELLAEIDRKEAIGRDRRAELDGLKALALETMANGRPQSEISLKQFRDAQDPSRACYQAIVRSRSVVDRLWDLREIESKIHVRVHQRASMPIVETLGLKVKWHEVGQGELTYHLQPLRPFWLRCDLRTDLGENIAWRDTEQWQQHAHAPCGYFEDPANVRVGTGLVAAIESDAPEASGYWKHRRKRQNIAALTRDWQQAASTASAPSAGVRVLTLDEAKAAIEKVNEPHAAIESILSAEWQHWGAPRWYRREVLNEKDVVPKPEFCVRRDSVGTAANDLFPIENKDDHSTCRSGPDDLLGWYPARREVPAKPPSDEPGHSCDPAQDEPNRKGGPDASGGKSAGGSDGAGAKDPRGPERGKPT